MVGRIIKEIVTFPLFLLVVLMTPVLAIGIKSFNNELKENHKKVLAALQKETELKRLLDYALSLGIKFSIHGEKKKKGATWYIRLNSYRPKGQTLLGKYNNFLSTFDYRNKQPIIYVQTGADGNLQPPETMQLIYFLSHELGHVINREKNYCERKRNPCLKDELMATLRGIKTLMALGYDYDFPCLAEQWTTSELMTLRCAECIGDVSCQEQLEGPLSISQEKDNTYTINYENIFEAVDNV